MIKTILWDIDRTLLDFDLCERNSLKAQFEKYHLPPCTPEIQALYARINIKYWDMLERREITKEQVLVKRFDELFEVLGIEGVRSEQFTVDYENGIADTTAFIENSPEILASLKGKYRQYAVTNGAYNVQTKRLHNAGFDEIFDGIFISDEVGYEKPSREFFDFVLSRIEPCRKDEILIVGDSLTSDMRGGVNAGIRTCRYNPAGNPDTLGIPIDYEIQSLSEIYSILAK
jgi:2-haloacid dehalogenase